MVLIDPIFPYVNGVISLVSNYLVEARFLKANLTLNFQGPSCDDILPPLRKFEPARNREP